MKRTALSMKSMLSLFLLAPGSWLLLYTFQPTTA
jgi:hypothetical protein